MVIASVSLLWVLRRYRDETRLIGRGGKAGVFGLVIFAGGLGSST